MSIAPPIHDGGAPAGIRCVRPPVIITGMHRSGTTLVSQCLHRLGLFLGISMQQEYESLFFLSINEEIFRRTGGSWDQPSPVRYLTQCPEAFQMIVRCLREDLLSSRVRGYLGLRRHLQWRSITSYDQPWGWKDPRSVYTLPLWLEVFPGAKIVYIIRNGVDVAHSLVQRSHRVVESDKRKFARRLRERKSKSALQRAGFMGSTRCLDLERSFALWEEYVSYADRLLAEIKNERFILKYEELLSRPEAHLAPLAEFCGLTPPDEGRLNALTAMIDPNRGNAFTADPLLQDYHARVKNTHWMRRLGYG
ncbi:MAG: sulfotransferase [Nitrospirota bacterium]